VNCSAPPHPDPPAEPHLPPSIRGEFRLVSRSLLLGWCLWLLGSWAINLLIDGPAVMPTVRWMLVCALLGLTVGWPVWRLSMATPPMPTLATLFDMVLLLAIFQILIVRVAIDWPIDHAVLIDAAVATWTLATAMLIDLGRRCGPSGRSLAMVGCLSLFIVPAAVVGPSDSDWAVAGSSLRAIWVLADPGTMVDGRSIGLCLAAIAGLVIVVWAVARGVMARRTFANHRQLT